MRRRKHRVRPAAHDAAKPRPSTDTWDWAPEREVIVGQRGNRFDDVLARLKAAATSSAPPAPPFVERKSTMVTRTNVIGNRAALAARIKSNVGGVSDRPVEVGPTSHHIAEIRKHLTEAKALHAKAIASHKTAAAYHEVQSNLIEEAFVHLDALRDHDAVDDGTVTSAAHAQRRKEKLDALDKTFVGRVRTPARPLNPPGVGGAFLTAQVREDEHKRLAAYWNAPR
jgi:hypothetical protein